MFKTSTRDYIYIYDGESSTSPLLAALTTEDNFIATSYKTSQQFMFVRFVSSNSGGVGSFIASYQSTKVPSTVPTSTWIAIGIIAAVVLIELIIIIVLVVTVLSNKKSDTSNNRNSSTENEYENDISPYESPISMESRGTLRPRQYDYVQPSSPYNNLSAR
jgi:hypothetical protein